MVDKKFGKNVLLVILSNGVKLLSSIATIFLLPLIFTQQDYGFYKLFLLYTSYVGFFHFGFIDGIYLYYGGKSYEELERSKFALYTKFLTITQLIIALGVFIFSFTMKGDRQLIMMLVSANVIVLNLTSYYQFISQITGRFKEFAIRNILLTVFNLTLIFVFLFASINNYLLFILLTLIINILLLLWYVFTYKDITFTKSDKLKIEFANIKLMFKLGIPLLLSNLVVMFMANLPKQFIEIVYPIEAYPAIFSNFSFAFTLVGFTSIFSTAISLVLYPTLKNSNKDTFKNSYDNFENIILVLIFLAITAYYPLSFIITRYIPEYTDSLKIFFILCPGIALTSSISVVKHNYYKTLNKNISFLFVGLISIVLLVLSMVFTYFLICTEVIYIAVVSVTVQFVFYMFSDVILQKELGIVKYKKILYLMLASIVFYSMAFISNQFYSMLLYFVLIVIVTTLFYFKDIKRLIKYFKTKEKNKIQNS